MEISEIAREILDIAAFLIAFSGNTASLTCVAFVCNVVGQGLFWFFNYAQEKWIYSLFKIKEFKWFIRAWVDFTLFMTYVCAVG